MSKAKVEHISPKQAWDMIQQESNVVFIDVRSGMEFLFIGHPVGAVNIPWIEEPDWEINPHFARDIRKLILGGVICHDDSQCAPIVLICRSGKRSAEAGQLLIGENFNRVYNVNTGFEGDLDETHHRSSLGGWRYDGLPWEQC
ncbi:MAG: rhodanese-like domain-containing protein [Gammaproteobacteria bacterium]|nr:rhodanese-like domain-containing protein [Gammaproteobacteria bacterium]